MENAGTSSPNSSSPTPLITIPLIDISPYLTPSPSPSALTTLAQNLHSAARSPGFFQITGHGVSRSLRAQLFAHLRAFFTDLSPETKASLHRNLSPAMRGYEGVGDQILEPGVVDQKEGFTIGAECGEGERQARFLQGRNQWPDEEKCPGFRDTMMEYFDAMRELSVVMFRLIAVSLGLQEGWFEEFVGSQDCEYHHDHMRTLTTRV